jgi:hypothetical protein
LKIATIVQLFLENQKRGICAGDVAMPVVIKAYTTTSGDGSRAILFFSVFWPRFLKRDYCFVFSHAGMLSGAEATFTLS